DCEEPPNHRKCPRSRHRRSRHHHLRHPRRNLHGRGHRQNQQTHLIGVHRPHLCCRDGRTSHRRHGDRTLCRLVRPVRNHRRHRRRPRDHRTRSLTPCRHPPRRDVCRTHHRHPRSTR